MFVFDRETANELSFIMPHSNNHMEMIIYRFFTNFGNLSCKISYRKENQTSEVWKTTVKKRHFGMLIRRTAVNANSELKSGN